MICIGLETEQEIEEGFVLLKENDRKEGFKKTKKNINSNCANKDMNKKKSRRRSRRTRKEEM